MDVWMELPFADTAHEDGAPFDPPGVNDLDGAGGAEGAGLGQANEGDGGGAMEDAAVVDWGGELFEGGWGVPVVEAGGDDDDGAYADWDLRDLLVIEEALEQEGRAKAARTFIGSGTWSTESMGALSWDLIVAVLMLLLPSSFVAPTFGWHDTPPEYVKWIGSMLRVSRSWYRCLLETDTLWGVLMAVAVSRPTWFFFLSLSHAAPKHLLYRGDQSMFGRLDGQLENARAVYADLDCGWRHWGFVLQGLSMPWVKIMLLRPREDTKPDGVLPSPGLSAFTPSLLHLDISSPGVFQADNLLTLITRNHSNDQLRNVIRPLFSLKRLEIYRTTSTHIDWTALLAAGSWRFLEELVVRCDENGSASLPVHAAPVEVPRLREIDVGGAVLARSAHARTMNVGSLIHTDLLRMLHQVPSLRSLSVESLRGGEWREGGWDDWDATTRVALGSLDRMRIESELSDCTVDILNSVWAPMLCELSLVFDASGPPNRAALDDVVALLNTAIAMGLQALDAVFNQARDVFRMSGHSLLASAAIEAAEAATAVDVEGNADAEAPENAARGLRTRVLQEVADPGERPAESILQDVLEASFVAWNLERAGAECVLVVELLDSQTISWYAAVEDAEGNFRYLHLSVTGTPLRPNWGMSAISDWDQIDSMAYGGARVLRGLRDLPTVELIVRHIEEDPFSSLGETFDDVRELSTSLAEYVELDTLRFELGPRASGTVFLRAMAAAALPCLTHIYVRSHCGDGRWAPSGYPAHRRWFDGLEVVLRRRAEDGQRVAYLEIQGYFCLCGLWLNRVREMVDRLVVDVSCTRRVRYICLSCDPTGGIFPGR